MAASSVRPWIRRLTALVSSMLLIATAAGGGAVQALQGLNKNITVVDISDLNRTTPTAAPTDTSPVNFLVMGSDVREGDGNTGYGDVSGARSDTTLLVHFYEGRESALVVSIPRDSLVTIDDCKDSDGTAIGPWTTKFNAAFAVGGPVCTIKTIEAETGILVDKFVVVDFNAFKTVIDAIGGVEVCLTTPVYDPVVPGRGGTGLNLPAGYSTINGKQALQFVRARESIGDGSDIGRIKRQQEFISSMMRGMEEAGLLRNPAMLYRVLAAITQSLTTSPDLGNINALQEFALSLANLKPANIKFVTTPFEYQGDGNVHWIPETDELWSAIKNEQAWPPPTVSPSPTASDSQSPAPTPSASSVPTSSVTGLLTAPEDINLEVLNGSGQTGLARTAADQLAKIGFDVNNVANAAALVTTTEIRYAKANYEAAKTTAASIGLAKLVEDNSLGTTVRVTVAKTWVAPKLVVIATPSASTAGTPSDPEVISAGAATCSEGNNRTKK